MTIEDVIILTVSVICIMFLGPKAFRLGKRHGEIIREKLGNKKKGGK